MHGRSPRPSLDVLRLPAPQSTWSITAAICRTAWFSGNASSIFRENSHNCSRPSTGGTQRIFVLLSLPVKVARSENSHNPRPPNKSTSRGDLGYDNCGVTNDSEKWAGYRPTWIVAP